ncbi:GDSL-type esterase/lipase family protein [Bacteroidales bacterium OttesenSCG-928-B11]|nr:GDSL-type esterase/lipase family protein [Bacteroidales bacterium OttesenSCG-928-C03]MDL2312738.1 GDSL-type esterase/lipase family protein [Bacteroidales bacterium OttesenSCG-928-B11]
MKLNKHILLLILAIFYFLPMMAQPRQVPIDTLKFANFEDNRLYFNKDSSNLLYFLEKFDEMVMTGEGNINIVHIGGSHVQAGVFPHRIRKDILLAFPDLIGRRGMIFPYSCAKKCNNPQDYRVSKSGEFSLIRNVYNDLARPLGATGIAVYTGDSSVQIKIKMNDEELRFETEQITLFGFSDSGTVVPKIIIDSTTYEPIDRDSALRTFTYHLPSVIDSFFVNIDIIDSGDVFTLTGILLDNSKPGITYHSLGVNGASVPSYLKCEYFVDDMRNINPDLVIFGLGINDASGDNFDTLEFVNNYLLLMDKFKEANPNCSFIFITNNDSYKRIARGKYSVNKRGPIVREQFYKLADSTGSAVWDQFHIMGGLKSMDKWYQHKYAKVDRVHFTNKGYELLGDLFYAAFMEAWTEYSDLKTIRRLGIEMDGEMDGYAGEPIETEKSEVLE